MKRTLYLLLFLPLLLLAAELKMEVVPLTYQSSEQLLPQLAPFITPPEQISGLGNRLILRATAPRLEELKGIIAKLDVMPRQFQISLRQGRHNSVLRSGEGVDGTLRYDSRDGGGSGEARVRIYRSHDRGSAPASQQLRLLEGHWGTLYVGRSMPIAEQRITQTPWGRQVEQQVRYRDVMSGFQVTARLTGEQTATLTIAPQRQMAGSGGVIQQSRMESMVSVPLGKWIEIGSSLEQLESRQGGTRYRTGARGWETQRIELMVELLP